MGFVAIIFVAVAFVQGVLASQWIRSCIHCVDWVFIISEVVAKIFVFLLFRRCVLCTAVVVALMSLSNSGFCDDVVFIYLGYVAGVFATLWSSFAVVFIDLGFVAIIFVAVVFAHGVLASQWIRVCVQGVD